MTQSSAKRLVVVHNKNDDLMGKYIAHKFREVGLECTASFTQDLASFVQPGSMVYVLPGALDEMNENELSKLGCVSITGYPALVEKGMVSIGLHLDDENQVKLIGSNSALTREGVQIPEKLQGLISSMAA